jgi:hypothetical protein
MYAGVGRDSLTLAGPGNSGSAGGTWLIRGFLPMWLSNDHANAANKARGTAWWIGLGGDFTLADPFRFAFDFVYGSYDGGKIRGSDTNPNDSMTGSHDWRIRNRGWGIVTLTEYKLDCVTPGLLFWYGSGDGKNPRKGGGTFPTIAPHLATTSFGFGAQYINSPYIKALSTNLNGNWGLTLRLADISFVKNLKHIAAIAYYSGTNHKDMADYVRHPSVIRPGGAYPIGPIGGHDYMNTIYMTTKDYAWEVNFDSYYDIYKNLQLGVKLGYINYKLGNNWNQDVRDDHKNSAYKIGIGMKYSF